MRGRARLASGRSSFRWRQAGGTPSARLWQGLQAACSRTWGDQAELGQLVQGAQGGQARLLPATGAAPEQQRHCSCSTADSEAQCSLVPALGSARLLHACSGPGMQQHRGHLGLPSARSQPCLVTRQLPVLHQPSVQIHRGCCVPYAGPSPASARAVPRSACSCSMAARPHRQAAWQSGGPVPSAASSASPEDGEGSCEAAPGTEASRCRAWAAPLTAMPSGSPWFRMRSSFCTGEARFSKPAAENPGPARCAAGSASGRLRAGQCSLPC